MTLSANPSINQDPTDFYRPKTESIPTIFDETFAPFIIETFGNQQKSPTYRGQKSPDQYTYILAIEIPRLIYNTISVEIEEDLKSTSQFRRVGYPSYNIVIKADQLLLAIYSNATERSTKKKYETECVLEGQIVALDGSLTLAYSEGVLMIEIPLQRPVEAKTKALSARLSDMPV